MPLASCRTITNSLRRNPRGFSLGMMTVNEISASGGNPPRLLNREVPFVSKEE